MSKTSSAKLRIILSLGLTVGLTLLLLGQINPADIGRLFAALPARDIVLICGIYFIYLQTITLRFRLLLQQPITYRHLLGIVCVHNFYNRFLPLRTGEVTYVYLLRKREGIAAAEGTASLIVARILDYISISVIFVASATILMQEIDTCPPVIVYWVAGLLILSVGILFSLGFIGQRFVNLLEQLLKHLHLAQTRLVRLLLSKGRELAESLQLIHSGRTYGAAFALSILQWWIMFSMHYLILRSLGIPLPWLMVGIGSTFTFLSNILPINTFGSFGIYEAGWTIGYMMVGLSQETAISSGFVMHLFFLLTAVVYGLLGLLLQRLEKLSAPS